MPRGIVGIKKFEEKLRKDSDKSYYLKHLVETSISLEKKIKINSERLNLVKRLIKEKETGHQPGSK
jgi:hypothetical protein